MGWNWCFKLKKSKCEDERPQHREQCGKSLAAVGSQDGHAWHYIAEQGAGGNAVEPAGDGGPVESPTGGANLAAFGSNECRGRSGPRGPGKRHLWPEHRLWWRRERHTD